MLEGNPLLTHTNGLPKVHKPGIPLRLITSDIGSAPHELATVLANPLSSLGSISGVHLRNSSDLIEWLRDIDFVNKRLACFDVKSLFTNVMIAGALETVTKCRGKHQ